jgi:hypothetical protein
VYSIKLHSSRFNTSPSSSVDAAFAETTIGLCTHYENSMETDLLPTLRLETGTSLQGL